MRRRVSKSLIEAKSRELVRLKIDREKYQVILDGKDTPFWKEMQTRVDRRAENAERLLDGWSGLPEKELFAVLEQRRIYRFFKDMVNESSGAVEILDRSIAENEEWLREVREGGRV